ncbi:MAG: hypothetical protein IPO81_28815 [Kouleothrix sp.]|nr:hypothetical protein [Kouleothrix sp.]
MSVRRNNLAQVAAPTIARPNGRETVELTQEDLAQVDTAPAVVWPTGRETVELAWEDLAEASAATTALDWGWLPALSLVCACGLLLVSLADSAARAGVAWAVPLFWGGLLVVYAPIVLRLAREQISRRESIGLVLVLGLGLYAVKILHSPLGFTHHDEFLHLRTVGDIIASGRLFMQNPLLPVSALFPGQEIVTAALVSVSGLPIFSAGLILIGVARLVLALSLYLLYEEISGSARVAGIGTALYMANPNFLFFVSMYKYESLAIPFAALVMFALARRAHRPNIERMGWTATAVLALGVVAITHHITSYALTAFLLAWTAMAALRGRRRTDRVGPGWMALLAVVANLAWLLGVAPITLDYLGTPLTGALNEFLRVAARDPTAGRQLFRSSVGQIAPLWERLTGFGAVGLVMLGLPFGLLQIWRRHRNSAIALTIAAGVLLYPMSLAFRLTKRGWESANRSSELLFVAVGLVLALGVTQFLLRGRMQLLRASALVACASVVFVGGIVAGWPAAWRLPGPYLPQADTRSIEPEGITAAEWTLQHLGRGNRVGADRTNMLLMGSYGEQQVSTSLSGGVDIGWVLFAPEIGAEQKATLQRGQIQYVVVDRRLMGIPSLGRSFYPQTSITHALEKFDRVKGINRVFDSGDIILYEVGAFAHAP